jgi:hypothetical protein
MGRETVENIDPQAGTAPEGSLLDTLDTSQYWVRAENTGNTQNGGTFRDMMRDRLAGGPTQPEIINVAQAPVVGDRAIGAESIVNGKLTLQYGEPDFDRKLEANPNYQQLAIQGIPDGVKVKHFVDAKGYFFWLEGSGEMEQIRGGDGTTSQRPRRHYYSIQAKEIQMNNETRDLEATRLKVNEALALDGGFKGFSSFKVNQQVDFQQPGNPNAVGGDAMNYFLRMSKTSSNILDIQAKSLEESVRTSDNPYFKIYLADVYTAQAMKPIIDQVVNGGRYIELNNPYSMKKMEDAISLLKSVDTDSRTGLQRVNRVPPANAVMPLDPYRIYNDPRDPRFSEYYYGFWGGSYDQAKHREVALTFMRNLMKNNAFPRIELP